MNDLLEDKELIDPPESRSFECFFCNEEVFEKYHGFALINQKEVDCCDWCSDDFKFCHYGKCILNAKKNYFCNCEVEND